ncbi:threonylcarbamoyl-AMP synthase [Leptotrichia sp. OH3620_COT-345]|uniref:L-threonylcarbamoyladenylate synthase n=1 Tax=Leptotrichia sp. OH3620_COT-345 TaxID=2491048 RepID=UPI000F6556CA|nr:L-threonylcarbamoyladenylate synthase [Leptotrichia sp. OH3620_COT-345]RRD37945.1 threonylcarbamoyl-AMP synthase [Leptotrichia sp. OH3620_COT-345]
MNDVKKAGEILRNGGVVVFPTDTVYGIGALPIEKSVRKIYEIKKRDSSKKIIALIDDISRLNELIDETVGNFQKIFPVLKRFWPGELTVVFKANMEFMKKFDNKSETLGIRIPKNETALEVIKSAGGVILTTSANISGRKSAVKSDEIDGKITDNVDYVIVEEAKLTGVPSTIIKYENGEITLLRQGNITLEEIKKLMKG